MDIEVFNRIKYLTKTREYDIISPNFTFDKTVNLNQYTIQKNEEMRIDLVMDSIYGGSYNFKDCDVILYINGIDNPLNLKEGQIIYYPSEDLLENFRYMDNSSSKTNNSVLKSFAYVDKTTRVDEKRRKYVENNWNLPPVVQSSSPSVRMDESNIIIGGL